MIIPGHERCIEVIELLQDEPALTAWEREFIESNLGRPYFSDLQKQVIARLIEKYEV